jgi:hypothetical protein
MIKLSFQMIWLPPLLAIMVELGIILSIGLLIGSVTRSMQPFAHTLANTHLTAVPLPLPGRCS